MARAEPNSDKEAVREKITLLLSEAKDGQMTITELAAAYERKFKRGFKREECGKLKTFVSEHFTFDEATDTVKPRTLPKKKKQKIRKRGRKAEPSETETIVGGQRPGQFPRLSSPRNESSRDSDQTRNAGLCVLIKQTSVVIPFLFWGI